MHDVCNCRFDSWIYKRQIVKFVKKKVDLILSFSNAKTTYRTRNFSPTCDQESFFVVFPFGIAYWSLVCSPWLSCWSCYWYLLRCMFRGLMNEKQISGVWLVIILLIYRLIWLRDAHWMCQIWHFNIQWKSRKMVLAKKVNLPTPRCNHSRSYIYIQICKLAMLKDVDIAWGAWYTT